jgi:uncharacterized protein YjaZ
MSIKLHILKASERLEKFEADINKAFEAGINDVQNKLTLPRLDVVVVDDADMAIAETGVGGSAPNAHVLYIYINPNFANLEAVLELEIRSTLAHELHHCARWAAVGYGTTLLEAIVSEGLADHFDIEVNGGSPKPWSIALSEDELQSTILKAKESFNSDYNHSDWFYGSKEIPRWAGYSLGFKIVGEYINKTGKSASELVATSHTEFIK